MLLRSPILLLLMCCFAPAASRSHSQIRSYTVGQGLAHNHVNRIYRDSLGFLWICTDEGLSRFDGQHFVNYTVVDGLPHIHINDIIRTRAGDYWLATDGGLTLFDPAHSQQRFLTFKPDGPPQALFVNALLEEPDGAVLVGTAAGLYRLRRGNARAVFERVEFPVSTAMLEAHSVNALYKTPNGVLWVGTVRGLQCRDRAGTWRRFGQLEGLPHEFIESIVPDPDGRIWVCTRRGLARLTPNPEAGQPIVNLTVTVANGLPANDVRAIVFGTGGRRWIGTSGGLAEWTAEAPTPANFRVYSLEDGLTDLEINALATGPDNSLWMGTRHGGLLSLGEARFQTFGPADGLGIGGYSDLLELPSGAICVFSSTDLSQVIRCFDGRSFRVTVPHLPADVAKGVPGKEHHAIIDHENRLWMSSFRGLLRFDSLNSPSDLRVLEAGESRLLFEDSRHDLWIATYGQEEFGLKCWRQADASLTDWSPSLPVRNRLVTALAEAPRGQLWLGLARPGGLFRWRNGHFEEAQGAPSGNLRSLLRDHAGRIWIASSDAGIGRIDDPAAERLSIRLFNRASGLSSNEVWSLIEDRFGRIYAGTGRGVDRIDPDTGRITHLSIDQGLLPGAIHAALCDQNGNLWFLANNGLTRLIPTDESREPLLEARITSVRNAGARHPVSELGQQNVSPAEFSWERNSFQIDYTAISFQNQPLFQFRLLGTQGGWSELSPETSVRFWNLASGNYCFEVRAINAGGVSSGPTASFPFTISPPPWRRWWFQAGLAGAFFSLAYIGHKVRLERRLALERVRSHIATDLHDDIGACLSRIAVMTEAVRNRVSTTDGDSQRMLAQIAETSRSLVDGMTDIVWSIDPRRDNLGDVVARLRAFGSDILEPLGVKWNCEGPSDALDRLMEPDQRRHFFLIFKEAIHNIARHSRAKNVVLKIAVQDHWVHCEIEDDGCGISSDSQGLGLASMRRRAIELGGVLEFATSSQDGTRISLHFLLL